MHLGQHAQMVTRHLHEGIYRHLPRSAGCYSPSATPVVSSFHYQDKKEEKLVCSNLALTLLFDISVCFPASCSDTHFAKPGISTWAPSQSPLFKDAFLSAGGCSGGSHPAFLDSPPVSSLSHFLLLHMCSGEGKPKCKDRCLEEEQTYLSAKPHNH